jgi:hypothetical protein
LLLPTDVLSWVHSSEIYEIGPLLTDLLEGTAEGRAESSIRAALAGFHPGADHLLIGVAADALETAAALAVIDAAHRTDLVRTLETFLLHGCSATRTAAGHRITSR